MISHLAQAASSHAHTSGSSAAGSLAPNLSPVHLVSNLFIAMAIIVVILWVILKISRGRNGLVNASRAKPGQITVLSRQNLARGVSVAVVRVAGKDLFVGVTPTGVTLLTEINLSNAFDVDVDGEPVPVNGNGHPSDDAIAAVNSLNKRGVGGQWTASQLGGASPLQAWMAKLDQLREMTVRRS